MNFRLQSCICCYYGLIENINRIEIEKNETKEYLSYLVAATGAFSEFDYLVATSFSLNWF